MPSSVDTDGLSGTAPRSRAYVSTTWGAIVVEAEGGEVVSCALPPLGATPGAALEPIGVRYDARPGDEAVLRRATAFVRRALNGRGRGGAKLIRWPSAAGFTLRAWRALADVPPGRTITYGELAARAGNRAAHRAAAQACARNPLPLFLPCHRVVAAGGGLGGFSAGRAWKAELLRREGGTK